MKTCRGGEGTGHLAMPDLLFRCKHAIRGPSWIGDTLLEGPPPAGLLHGDTTDNPQDPLPSRRPGRYSPLVGILDLMNRTRYGFSSRGVPQYLFHPLDTRFPPLIVGSKAPTTANMWAVARIEIWNPTHSRWPKGALQQLIGPTDDTVAQNRALTLSVSHASLPLPYPHPDPPHSLTIPADAVSSDCCEEEWDMVLNIDPAGCRDVDDVLGWRREPTTGVVEFGIFIADVAAAVVAGSAEDQDAYRRAETVYNLEGGVVAPMLPPVISEEGASLLADGQARPVLGCIWALGATEPTWRSLRLRNHRTYTYESILKDTDMANTVRTHLTTFLGEDVGTDPHHWIERAMIAYNRAAAQRLVALGHGVLRAHSGTLQTQAHLLDVATRVGCPEIAWLATAAGTYVDVVAEGPREHVGLGEAVYCHATSPLRRYADLINQRLLKGSAPQPVDVAHLNERSKAIKVFSRQLWCVQHVSSTHLTRGDGWVLGWRFHASGDARLLVYVPAWKRTVRVSVLTSGACAGTSTDIAITPLDAAPWKASVGTRVWITAFCNPREAEWERRFVFRVEPQAQAP